MALPLRWERLRPHPAGEAYTYSPHRFNTVAAGRRSGKTERAKRKLILKAGAAGTLWTPRFFAGAPTRDQAKRIFWDDIKAMVPGKWLACKPSETELKITLVTGAELWVLGMDVPARIEGQPWDGGILDEIANMKPGAWSENVRPALSDRRGWCDLIGVPEGRNHYYDLDRQARAMMTEYGDASEWGSYSWPSSDVLPRDEIDAARRDLDELTFQQEYEASFVNFAGRAYYQFEERTHCARLTYDPKQPLCLCFDFNVEPGVAAILQEQKLPSGLNGTGVISEVYIPRNSNTQAVCRKIISEWHDHLGSVYCFGDATGGSQGTAKVLGSDWELIRQELRPVFGDRLIFKVKSANPRERARINAVNTRLKSASGEVRLMVDPIKAPNVVRDFEGVQLLKGGSGEIDKKISPGLTHMCFAAGTMVEIESGPCPIEQAPKVGKVRTWDGSFVSYENIGKTMSCVNTIAICISDGIVVYCTPDHLFLTKEGWVCAKNLKGMILSGWGSLLTHLPDKPSIQKSSIDTMEKSDISGGQTGKVNNTYTASYGDFITGLFQKVYTYIISMVTKQTTKLKTLIYCLQKLISDIISILTRRKTKRLGPLDSYLPVKLLRLGMEVTRGIYGTLRMGLKNHPEMCLANAHTVMEISWLHAHQYFVAKNARQAQDTMPGKITSREYAPFVETDFRSTAIQKQNIVAESAPQELRVTSVKPAGKSDVYCLYVPHYGCFALENGAIVSNSDAIGYRIEYDFPVVKPAGKMQLSGV